MPAEVHFFFIIAGAHRSVIGQNRSAAHYARIKRVIFLLINMHFYMMQVKYLCLECSFVIMYAQSNHYVEPSCGTLKAHMHNHRIDLMIFFFLSSFKHLHND